MTPKEKKQAWDRAYYQRNKGRISKRNKERYLAKKKENTEKGSDNSEKNRMLMKDIEKSRPKKRSLALVQTIDNSKQAEPDLNKPEKLKEDEPEKSNYSRIELFFRTSYLVGMTAFLVLLQVEFYEKNDSSSFPTLMAVACELSLVSLALTRFQSVFLDCLRWFTLVGLFIYTVGSLSYDVYNESRRTLSGPSFSASSHLVGNAEGFKLEINDLREKEKIALERGAWSLARSYSQRVTEKESKLELLKNSEKLGITDGQLLWVLVMLIVFLRAALTVSNALNATKLGEIYSVCKFSNKFPSTISKAINSKALAG